MPLSHGFSNSWNNYTNLLFLWQKARSSISVSLLTFDLLTPSDLRNKVTKAIELKKPQERKTKAIEDFIKQIESEIEFVKGAPINPITKEEFKDNEAYKAYLQKEAEARYKVIFPNSK